MDRTGHFTCTNPLADRLYQNQVWGQKSNYIEVPTDCPQRDERMGYPGDGQVFALTGAYNYDTEKFWAKYLGDMRSSQQDNTEGYVGPVIPCGRSGRSRFYQYARLGQRSDYHPGNALPPVWNRPLSERAVRQHEIPCGL